MILAQVPPTQSMTPPPAQGMLWCLEQRGESSDLEVKDFLLDSFGDGRLS